MENYREYRGRNQRKIPPKKPEFRYPKKLIRQTVISLLILAVIFSPMEKNGTYKSKIKDWVSFALSYQIDIEKISDAISNILQKSIYTSGQGDSNDEEKSIEQKAF